MPPIVGLRPDYDAASRANAQSLLRAVTANAVGYVSRSRPQDVLRQHWPNDSCANAVIKAASSPTTTATGSALLRTIVADFIAALGPELAAAQLFAMGLRLSFDEGSTISLPGFVADPAHAGFVGEAAPIPVRQFNVAAPAQLTPFKLMALAVLTSEMIESSNAESLISDVLTRSAALALDSAVFDSSAGDTTRPAGLRHGVSALTASTSTDSWSAMISDVSAIAGAVSAVGGGADVAVIGSPARALSIRLRWPSDMPLTVLASSAVAAGDLIAVAPAALVSATGDSPEITAARETALVMDDAAPGPPDAGQHTMSLFQVDDVGIKVRLPCGWVLRDPRAVAWLTTTAW